MFFDLYAWKKILDFKRRNEHFTTKESKIVLFLNFVVVLYLTMYFMFMLFAMGMFIMSTFKCSVKEGFSSIFFTNPYILWKLSKMISFGCQTK